MSKTSNQSINTYVCNITQLPTANIANYYKSEIFCGEKIQKMAEIFISRH
jgi:hypothetical protein